MVFLDGALGPGAFEAMARGLRREDRMRDALLVGLTRDASLGQEKEEERLLDAVLPKPFLERKIRKVLRLLADKKCLDCRGLSSDVTGGEPSEGGTASRMRGRVLLVEDDEINRLMTGNMLRKMGLSFQVAEDGAKALEVLEENHFNAILMDCQMPEMDGFETTRAIRNWGDQRSQTPIIALTASALEGDRERCLLVGMDDYVAKPLTLSQLRDALGRWLPEEQVLGTLADEEIDEVLAGAVYDRDAALHRVGGNLELLREVGRIFFAAWEENNTLLRECLARGDGEGFSSVAHKVKGSAMNLSAEIVAELSGELEVLGLQLRLAEADPVVERLEQSVRAFREVFERDPAIQEVST
jgi:CheY-like chemotaxis protein/HPt (histidine-containing phosphotransfer) domain-containing protein